MMTPDADYIENKTFDEIKIGDSASLTRKLVQNDMDLFAVMSGNINPAHVDPEFAKSDIFHKVIANGMWGAALISTVLGTEIPGPGTIYLDQSLHFLDPVALGDTITITVTARKKEQIHHHITFDCKCVNQQGKLVIDGTALVKAPVDKIKQPRVILPEVRIEERGAKFRHMITMAEALDPIVTALDGLVMGRRCGTLDPGVVLYLIREKGMDYEALTDLLYHHSGLLGISGISDDMRDLLTSRTQEAGEAVELFVYRIARELGSLAAALGGLDALVFTGGIGEHAAIIRERVCRQAEWLGIKPDYAANNQGAQRISLPESPVPVFVIPTDEDQMIARHTLTILKSCGGMK